MVYLDKNKILVGTRKKRNLLVQTVKLNNLVFLFQAVLTCLTSLYITLDQHIYTSFMDLDYIAMTKQEKSKNTILKQIPD